MKIVLACLLLMFLFVVPALAQTGGEESPGGGESDAPAAQAVTATATVAAPAAPTATPAAPAAPPSAAGAIKGTPIRLDTPLTISLDGETPVNLSYKSPGNETITVSVRSLADEDVL